MTVVLAASAWWCLVSWQRLMMAVAFSPCAKMWGQDGLYPDSTGGGMAFVLSNSCKSIGLGWHFGIGQGAAFALLLPVGCRHDTFTLVPHLVVTSVIVLLVSA